MAIKNPKKQFNFRVQILGAGSVELPIFAIQGFTVPDLDIEADEHGYGNTVIKTPGLVRVGNATLERIESSINSDLDRQISRFFLEWANKAANAINQTSATDYYKKVLVHEVNPVDGVTPILTHVLYECFPIKINGKEFKRAETGNLVNSVELSVNFYTAI
jgi:hypothetical protein